VASISPLDGSELHPDPRLAHRCVKASAVFIGRPICKNMYVSGRRLPDVSSLIVFVPLQLTRPRWPNYAGMFVRILIVFMLAWCPTASGDVLPSIREGQVLLPPPAPAQRRPEAFQRPLPPCDCPNDKDRRYWGGGQKRLVQNWWPWAGLWGARAKGYSFRERRWRALGLRPVHLPLTWR